MADNPQLPNFATIGDNHARIATAHEQLSREMQHMTNLPPIEGNRMMQSLRNITQELVTLRERMDDRFTRMEDRFTRMEDRFTRIDVHLEVNDYNSIARSFNSTISRPDNELRPVKKLDATLPVNFPATPAVLSALSAPTLNALLTEYGLPVVGSLAQKRQQLRMHVGLAHMG